MSRRNIYFYSLKLRKIENNEDVTKEMNQLFNNIFSENSISTESSKSLRLQNGKITLDILENDDDFLFARVGKQTEYYNIVKRDTATMKSSFAVDPNNNNQVLEVCTYFLLDYNKGIVGFIFGKSAPTPNSLISLVSDYDNEHYITITRIVSPESVKALLKPGSKLKTVKYVMRTPNIEVLEHIGIKDNLKAKMMDMEMQEIEIIIKNGNRSVFGTETEAKEFIEEIFNCDEKENISIVGNSGKSRQKEFKFLEQDISFPIEIKDYESIEGTKEKRRLGNEEININVLKSLKKVYNDNHTEILMFAGMYYDE